MLTLQAECECVCVYLNVLGAYASHHIFILGAAPCSFHTHTEKHAHLSSLSLLVRAACLAACLPASGSWLRSRLSPRALCAPVYISTCLSACSVKSGHQGFFFFFFNCFLPPTGPKYREAQQCSLCLESVDREKETEFVPTLHNQSSILYVFIHIVYFNLRTLVHFQSGWATYKSKASSYL